MKKKYNNIILILILLSINPMITYALESRSVGNASDDIQKIIFKYNLDVLHERFKTEMEKINIDNKIKEDENISKINMGINFNLNKYKKILENVVKTSASDLEISEAYFRLSLINLEENKGNYKKSIDLIEKGLQKTYSNQNDTDLYIKMNFLAGDLYILKNDYSKSYKFYKNVEEKINNKKSDKLYLEEKIRAIIAQGDCSYLQLNFNSALGRYKAAESILRSGINLNQKLEQRISYLLEARMILTEYKNGNYKNSLDYIKKYSYKIESYKKYMADMSNKNIIDIGAISLFELKDYDIFEKISEDKIFGDFGKEIILQSFPIFIKSGNAKFIDKVSQNIKKNFSLSKNYPLFLKEWINASQENEDKDNFFNVCYSGVTEISKKSLWFKKFILDKEQNDLRKNIILKHSIPAANYFYEQGVQKKSKIDFLKSAEIYNARLEENEMNDNKGLLFQQFSESLYMAGDYSTALTSVERSLKYDLEEPYVKSGLFLHLKIMRSLSSDAKNTNENNYKLYEDSVDNFFNQFPREQQARDGLFESAKRAEVLGDFENSKKRYERLLSNAQEHENDMSLNEINKSVKSLAAVILKIKEKNIENVNIAGKMESYADKFSTNNEVRTIIKSANSNLAQNYYEKLNKDGKLLESATFLSTWAQNNNANPDSSKLYINSTKTFAQLQDWKKVLLLSENFGELYPNDNRMSENLFWQGRANDNLLLFNQAAISYEKSVNTNAEFPILKDKKFALERAIEIYISLNKKIDAARVFELKSKFLVQSHSNPVEIALAKMGAAKIYFDLKNMEKAKNLYKAVSSIKNLPNYIKNESQINFLLSNINNDKNAITEIDSILLNYLKDKGNINKDFLRNSVNYINALDEELFAKNYNDFRSFFNKSSLNNMFLIIKRAEQRSASFRDNQTEPDMLASTYALLGKLNQNLAEGYSYSFYNYKKFDNYLKFSEKYHTAAKKFFSAALMTSKVEDAYKMKIYVEAKRYFKIPQIYPDSLLFKDELTSTKLLQDLYSSNQVNQNVVLKRN